VNSKPTDPWIERLTRLFREHPAWRDAAQMIDPRAMSNVFFAHRPGEVWHLERRREETLLLPGAAPDPDFAFRFSAGAIARLEAVQGDAGDFAVELFERTLSEDPETRVDIRIVASFVRLAARGYVRLLLASGSRVRALGAAHRVVGLRGLRRLVATLRTSQPNDWEVA
jgi:hypothetical protein